MQGLQLPSRTEVMADAHNQLVNLPGAREKIQIGNDLEKEITLCHQQIRRLVIEYGEHLGLERSSSFEFGEKANSWSDKGFAEWLHSQPTGSDLSMFPALSPSMRNFKFLHRHSGISIYLELRFYDSNIEIKWVTGNEGLPRPAHVTQAFGRALYELMGERVIREGYRQIFPKPKSLITKIREAISRKEDQ